MLNTLKLFHKDGDVVEIRVIGKVASAGYFLDFELAAKEAKRYDRKANIYFVMNRINQSCYHRENKDRIVAKATSTSDNDIENREWLLLDFDPKRASYISSTDDEKRLSEEIMKEAATYLSKHDFKAPVIADSGNGWHLLYKISVSNDLESKKTIEGFLNACDMLFSNDKVQVDKAVFNASRITKLYGVMAVKGSDTPERPHRRSSITFIPKVIETTAMDKIKAISDLILQKEARQQQSNEFDLYTWISNNNIRVLKTVSWEGGTRHILEQCPFDSAHGKDSAIIQLSSGALVFHCFHNGCANNTWKEFRALYDTPREYNPTQYKKPKQAELVLSPSVSKEIDKAMELILSKAKKVKDILPFDRSKVEIFSTGIPTLDGEMEILFGKVGIVTGVNGSGKSTILSQLMLEALEQKYKVFTYSGELKSEEFQYWTDLQAAGREYLNKKTSKNNKTFYEINSEAKRKIHDWYDDKFYLYNNEESMKYEDILLTIEAYRVHENCRVIFLDNFMTIDISNLDDKELVAQTKFIWSLAKYAKKENVLVFLVVHPKKIYEGICQKQDVLGTGNFSNAIDFMLIIHRVNEVFLTHLAKRKINKLAKDLLSRASNVIEVGKDRWTGKEGLSLALEYCEDSKRLIDINVPVLKDKRYSWDNKQEKDECPWG